MPFVDSDEDAIYFNKLANAVTRPIEEEDGPTILETAGAYWRQENIIGSFVNRQPGLPDGVDDQSFNPFDYFTEEEKRNEKFISHAAYADTEDEINAVRDQFAQETADRKTIEDAGMLGAAVGLPIMMADLTLIPIGGAIAGTYKAGNGLLKAGMITGSVAGAEAAVTEAALHKNQMTREFGESAINVGASMLLGGALGSSFKALARQTPEQLDQVRYSTEVEPKIAEGKNTVLNPELVPEGDLSVGAMEELGDVKISGKAARILAKAFAWDPLTQGLLSASKSMRKATASLFENPYDVDGGVTNAIQSEASLSRGLLANALERHNKLYRQYKKGGGKLRPYEFNQAVSRALRNGDVSGIPEAAQSAQAFRRELYDPIKENAIEVGLLPEDVDVSTAVSYLNRRWNKDAINANLPQFISKVSDWLKSEDVRMRAEAQEARVKLAEPPRQVVRAEVKDDVKADDLLDEIEDVADVDRESGLVTVYHRTNATDAAVIMKQGKFIPKEDGIFFSTSRAGQAEGFGDTVLEFRIPADRLEIDDAFDGEFHLRLPAKANKGVSIKQYIARPKGLSKAETARLEKAIARDEAKIADPRYDSETGLADDDYYQDIADRISQRISVNHSLPYDWKIGEGSSGGKVNGVEKAGVFKERVFNIPDNLVEEFLENDIEMLANSYARSTAIDIEMMRRYGTTSLDGFKTDIANDYTALQVKAKNEAERVKLGKQSKRDQDRLQAMYDRIRGVYNIPDPDNPWVRAGRVARNLNYMRFMGGVVASSIPDVARIFMAEGFGRTFSKGLIPLVSNLRAFKMSAKEARQYGVGAELLLQGRSKVISDIDDYMTPSTRFERGVQSMTDKFGRINLMDYWTTSVKQLHAVTMQNSIIDDLLKGVIDPRLKRLGITDTDATLMMEQLKKHADKSEGVWLSNARNWDDPDLERKWGAMLAKESRRVIVEPGQEKPLFMSSELGKTIFQFKSFMFASTQRMTIATLQGQDRNAVGGVLTLISLGMLSYAFKQWDADRELSDDPKAWIAEGIDRSGALGSIMEINNTLEKLSNNGIGLRPVLGIEAAASRFVSRSMSENILGPTLGSLLDTSLRVTNAGLTPGDWTDADTRAIRRLIPYQNLSFIRQGLDRIEEEVGDL